jgi:hypothetical protein
MKNMPPPEKSLLDLVADLRDETKELIRQEIQLAKTEIAEKAAKFGRNAAWLAVGGFLAYAGLIVFLIGLGFLIGFALEALGMAQAVANFLGSAIIGLGTAGIGYFLVAKALKILSQESLTPERTLHTIREFHGSNTEPSLPPRRRPAAARPSSAEMESLIDSTQRMVKGTATALQQRLTIEYLGKRLIAETKKHALLSSIVAAATSFAGYWVFKRRLLPRR